MLAKQRKEPGEAVITTVLFDDDYELLHNRINIKGILPITEKEYCVSTTVTFYGNIKINNR